MTQLWRLSAGLLLACSLAEATSAATLRDWFGTYDMNHDGWRGTLTISDSKVDCAAPAWCALVLRYRDAEGNDRRARIQRMDAQLDRMTFVIEFPGNRQRFDAYLFSHEPIGEVGLSASSRSASLPPKWPCVCRSVP